MPISISADNAMALALVNQDDRLVLWDPESDTFDIVGGPHTPADPYFIRVKRCMTRDDLLYWICHLSTKAWFTRGHLVQLIRVFRCRTGVDPR